MYSNQQILPPVEDNQKEMFMQKKIPFTIYVTVMIQGHTNGDTTPMNVIEGCNYDFSYDYNGSEITSTQIVKMDSGRGATKKPSQQRGSNTSGPNLTIDSKGLMVCDYIETID
jgi:hypothetical protein